MLMRAHTDAALCGDPLTLDQCSGNENKLNNPEVLLGKSSLFCTRSIVRGNAELVSKHPYTPWKITRSINSKLYAVFTENIFCSPALLRNSSSVIISVGFSDWALKLHTAPLRTCKYELAKWLTNESEEKLMMAVPLVFKLMAVVTSRESCLFNTGVRVALQIPQHYVLSSG